MLSCFNMANASPKNWESTFTLSDAARRVVLRTSRFRRRPSSIAARALSPAQPNMYNATNSHLTGSLSSSKTIQTPGDDSLITEDAVSPSSPTRKQLKRRICSPPNKASPRFSDDEFPCSVACTVKPPLSKQKHLTSAPPTTTSSCEDGENVDRSDCTKLSSPTDANTSSSHKSHCKRTKLCAETVIETSITFDNQTAIRLHADFFQCDALELAPKLLGKLLRRDEVVLQITEVEAYRPNDSACHGRFGVTPRTAPVFGPGGHAYVYLCYGLHVMLNVVADVKGVGAAVLIRSCAPVAGMQTIQSRRGSSTNKPVLLTGPGKVGQALGLTTDWSNHPLYTTGGLEVLDGPPPERILVGPRVGIDYANPEDVTALWRFAISGTAWISAPRNTLEPLQSYG